MINNYVLDRLACIRKSHVTIIKNYLFRFQFVVIMFVSCRRIECIRENYNKKTVRRLEELREMCLFGNNFKRR